MTNYYKVYLKSNQGYQKQIAKDKAGVINILNQAKKEGFKSYLIIRTIKSNTDIPIARGEFCKECKIKYIDELDTDWRIVGSRVVDWNKYKKAKEYDER